MYDITKLVPLRVFEKLLRILPTSRQKRRGRKRVTKKGLLNGILQVLVNGVGWRKIADCGCGYASYWRYFRELQRRGKLKLIYQALAQDKTNVIEGAVDKTTSTSLRFRRMTGWDGKHQKIGTHDFHICRPERIAGGRELRQGKQTRRPEGVKESLTWT